MASPVRDTEWLTWVTKLMESSVACDPAPRRARDGFCCRLDEQSTHLVPERLLRQLQPGAGEDALCFNPRCHLSGTSDALERLRAAELAFAQSDGTTAPIAWVEDPATRAWTPFWLSTELATVLRELQKGTAKIQELPVEVRTVLRNAGVLVSTNHSEERRRAWAVTVERFRRKFRESGYAPIAGLIHPFQLAELRRYFRRQIRRGALLLGDGQSPRRYIAHNDPAARFFHGQLTEAVSDLVGEAVKPSYVYMASYQSGARLEKHTDRAQCEFSITLCLDYSPEPRDATPWPVYFDVPTGTVTVYQALGDGLLYRGRELPHYRGTLAAGNTSTSIFFHYVAADFDGPLE